MTISSRGSLGRLLGALVFGVIVLAGAGLFAIQYHHQRAEEALRHVIDDAGRLDQARSAQVGFKLQVQEWKNLLLRSRSDEDLARLTGVFTAQAAAVSQQLDALATAPGMAAEQRAETEQIKNEHQVLVERYRAAIESYSPSDAQTIFAVDAAVRGIDRGLDQRIDALAEAMLQTTRAEAEALHQRGVREYGQLRTAVSLVALAVIVLSGVVAWLATRTAVSPPPRAT